MNWFTIILKLLGLLLSWWTDTNADRKAIRERALKEVLDGIKKRDPSKITAGFDTANN